jgi:hypothetical protein
MPDWRPESWWLRPLRYCTVRWWRLGLRGLQGMQIHQQIVDLLLIEHRGKARHFFASQANNLGYALVIGGQSAHFEIGTLEDIFHARALTSSGRIGGVAAVAIVVIEAATGGLLRSEAEFSIAPAELDVTTRREQQGQCADAKSQGTANLFPPQRQMNHGSTIIEHSQSSCGKGPVLCQPNECW